MCEIRENDIPRFFSQKNTYKADAPQFRPSPVTDF